MHRQPLTHFRSGRIFTADPAQPWAESLIVDDGRIVFAGSTADAEARLAAGNPNAAAAAAAAVRTVDLAGWLVLPGIVEAHSHLVNLGRSLDQVDLLSAADLPEMQRRIAAAAADRPDAPRILGRSWLLAPLAGAQPHRDMLDAVVSDRPVYLVSNDLHSGWVNTAALLELGIDEHTPDPEGGTIVRDASGAATGLLLETAALVLMRGGIESLEDDAVRDRAVRGALASYRAAGVTATADLGLRSAELAALERAWELDELEIPVAGYVRVETSIDPDAIDAQLAHAISTRDRVTARAQAKHETGPKHESEPMLSIRGIKMWIDGVIDSGTAAMVEPFSDGGHPEALWRRDLLLSAVAAADRAGLQVAMHAIGDAGVALALDAVEEARRANGDSGIRHRIEHLEVVTGGTAERLVRLGVIASVQPVHATPEVQGAWRAQLGDDRVDRGYPWAEFDVAGATIALGTDAPTAPYAPLQNLYLAVTRRSPARPELPANHPELRLSLERAIVAATRDAAAACGWGGIRGELRAGLAADFIVLDVDPFADGPEVLREAAPALVVVRGAAHE